MSFKTVLTFLERFGIYIGIGLILYFGYQGLFGKSSALNLIKDNAIRMEERMKLWELQDKQRREQLDALKAEVLDKLSEMESHRQNIGTRARESYHPDMKSYSNDLDQQIEDAANLFGDYGLSD